MKQLSKSLGPAGTYVAVLPGSPGRLLVEAPDIARKLFDKDNLPITSPLNSVAVQMVRSRVNLRLQPGSALSRAQPNCKDQMPNMSLPGLCFCLYMKPDYPFV